MHTSLLVPVLLCSGTLLAAQSTPTLFTQPPQSVSCPVKLSAERTPNSGLVEIDKKPVSPSLGLDITFADAPSTLVGARITVHGFPTHMGTLPLANTSVPKHLRHEKTDETTESFTVGGDRHKPLLHAIIEPKKLMGVSWVEVDELQYADGTVWHPATAARCVTSPSLFVLVDAPAYPDHPTAK